jgi:hypothetical protein
MGDVPSVVERLSGSNSKGTFRMFMDVDLDKDGDEEDAAEHIIKSLPDVLKDDEVIVCKKKNSIKRGLHIIFNKIFVTAEMAMSLVTQTVDKLCSQLYKDAIDTSVYNKNGLRMIYSAKGPDSTADDAYLPWFVSLPNADVKVYVDDPFKDMEAWLSRCSIIPPCIDKDTVLLHNNNTNIRTRTRTKKSSRTKRTNSDVDDLQDVQVTELIRDLLQNIDDQPYADVNFKIVHNTSDKVYIVNMESTFCMNIGRHHNSNRVYLMIKKTGVWQGCHCKCPNGQCVDKTTLIEGPESALSQHYFGEKTLTMRILEQRANASKRQCI